MRGRAGSLLHCGSGEGGVDDNSKWRPPSSHAASWKVHCPDGCRDRGYDHSGDTGGAAHRAGRFGPNGQAVLLALPLFATPK